MDLWKVYFFAPESLSSFPSILPPIVYFLLLRLSLENDLEVQTGRRGHLQNEREA